MENQLCPLPRESSKWQDRSKLESPNLSYADLHSKITNNEGNISRQDQRVKRESMAKEELVKYMSNLPRYLERGEKFQEKAFNVGVLDWRRLEKWRYTHKQIPQKTRYCSPSSSNTSSFFSTDGSSTHSSRGHSSSPSRQVIHGPTLQVHLKAPARDGNVQGIKSVVGNVGKFQDAKPSSSMLERYQSLGKHHPEIKLKEYKREDLGPHILPEKHTSSVLENYSAQRVLKGKMKVQDGSSTAGTEKLQEPYDKINNDDCPETYEKIVLLLPRDDPENSHSAISHLSCLKEITGRRSVESSRRSFSDAIFPQNKCHSDLYSNIPHSCPLSCDVESIEQSTNFDFSSKTSESSARIWTSPSRSKNPEEKKSTVMSTKSVKIKSSKGSELNMEKVVTTRVRNPSPFRRVADMIGRSSISKNGSDTLQLSSMTCKSGSEGLVDPINLDCQSSDRPNSRSRGRSSPLRRLIDPFFKPKAENSNNSAGPSQKDSKSNGREGSSSKGRSSPLRRLIEPLVKPKVENSHTSAEPLQKDSTDGRVESSAAHSLKGKLDCTNCRAINVDGAYHEKSRGSSRVQALLRIVIKNGLPLFTFAVDNNSEILAATMKKLRTSEKGSRNWIFTFFAVREVKKKNGLMTRGGKAKDHGYVPNVVAQMKVSDSRFSGLIKDNTSDQFGNREFVLFAVDQKLADQQRSELRPNDELAAIVFKFPKVPSLEVRGYSDSRDNEKNGSLIGVGDFFSTSVILPGGVHGLSFKGEPSPLLERWKSGGLCDCGGWDMGCRIRVISNSEMKSSNPGQFDLLSQGEDLDNRPVFSLSPFKDGVFSVDFGSCLTLLQAFAICVSILSSKKPYELSDLGNAFEEKFPEETTLVEQVRNKASNRLQVTTCPPDSPVGRV